MLTVLQMRPGVLLSFFYKCGRHDTEISIFKSNICFSVSSTQGHAGEV